VRDSPASSPAAIVAIERDVPGNTGASVWHIPTHNACPNVIVSTSPDGRCPYIASTAHIIIPPTMNEVPMITRLSRCFPMIFSESSASADVHANAYNVRLSGWFRNVRSPRTPFGKDVRNSMIRRRNRIGRHRIAPS